MFLLLLLLLILPFTSQFFYGNYLIYKKRLRSFNMLITISVIAQIISIPIMTCLVWISDGGNKCGMPQIAFFLAGVFLLICLCIMSFVQAAVMAFRIKRAKASKTIE